MKNARVLPRAHTLNAEGKGGGRGRGRDLWCARVGEGGWVLGKRRQNKIMTSSDETMNRCFCLTHARVGHDTPRERHRSRAGPAVCVQKGGVEGRESGGGGVGWDCGEKGGGEDDACFAVRWTRARACVCASAELVRDGGGGGGGGKGGGCFFHKGVLLTSSGG